MLGFGEIAQEVLAEIYERRVQQSTVYQQSSGCRRNENLSAVPDSEETSGAIQSRVEPVVAASSTSPA